MENLADLKTDLLCRGIRVDPGADYYAQIVPSQYPGEGKSRAGVAGSGRCFHLDSGPTCNIGVRQPFLEQSPYEFRIIDHQGWILKAGEKVVRAYLGEPSWHQTRFYDQIQLHGDGTLATALSNYCRYKAKNRGCKFCIINTGERIIQHHPAEVAGAIAAIEQNPELRAYNVIGINHPPGPAPSSEPRQHIEPDNISINSGTFADRGMKIYLETISAIREVSNLPIGIQIWPLKRKEIRELHSAGADVISFNLEVYSQEARRAVIPGKSADYPRGHYLRALEEAVEIFGENQVESWIIIGLEPGEKTIEGIRQIARTGAIPLPVPFRPLYGAEYESHPPPRTEDALEVYQAWLDIVREFHLNPLEIKAGCGKCNACFPLSELISRES